NQARSARLNLNSWFCGMPPPSRPDHSRKSKTTCPPRLSSGRNTSLWFVSTPRYGVESRNSKDSNPELFPPPVSPKSNTPTSDSDAGHSLGTESFLENQAY